MSERDHIQKIPKDTKKHTTTESGHKMDGKLLESNHKTQPTAEQLRIARMITDSKKIDDLEIQSKINQVIELTGKSADEAVIALHDCDMEPNRAVEMLLEGDDQGEWETSGKKRKNKVAAVKNDLKDSYATEKVKNKIDSNDNLGMKKGQGRSRGIPRLQKHNGSLESRTWKQKENKENEKNMEMNDVGNGRGRSNRLSNGPYRGRGQNNKRGLRMFRNRNQQRDRGDPSVGLPKDIDTWSNQLSETEKEKMGTWDSFPITEDWDNEEWTGSLSDTKVFTASNSQALDLECSVLVSNNPTSPVRVPVLENTLGNPEATSTSTSVSGSHLQTLISQPSLLQSVQSLNSNLGKNEGVTSMTSTHQQIFNQFTQEAESLKTAMSMNAGSQNLTSGPSYNRDHLLFGNSTSAHDNDNPVYQPKSKQSRSKLSSKIPSLAVEMPDDGITQLDVQFGALDFGAESCSFDFVSPDSLPPSTGNKKVSVEGFTADNISVSSAGISSDFSLQKNKISSYPTAQSYIPSNSAYSSQSSYSTTVYGTSQASNSYTPNGTTFSHPSEPGNNYQTVLPTNASYASNSSNQVYGNASSYPGVSQYQPYANSSAPLNSLASITNAKIISGHPTSAKENQFDGTPISNVLTTSAGIPPGLILSGVATASLPLTTSNSIKNSIVTSKVPNMPPGVAVLNTQYLMGQAGHLTPFYMPSQQQPLYYEDLQLLQQRFPHLATGFYELAGFQAPSSLAAGSIPSSSRDTTNSASFSVTPDPACKFRGDVTSGSPVQTTLSQPGSAQQQQPFLNHHAATLPPPYYAYYSGGVIPGDAFHHSSPGNIATSQLQKLASTAPYFDSLAAHPQDYAKAYGAANTAMNKTGLTGTTMAGTPDLSASYKGLGKSFDKQGFHGGTPPPFNLAGTGAAPLGPGTALGHFFIPASHLQHSSLVPHHQVHQDGGLGNQRSQSSAMPNKSGTKQQIYNPYWPTN